MKIFKGLAAVTVTALCLSGGFSICNWMPVQDRLPVHFSLFRLFDVFLPPVLAESAAPSVDPGIRDYPIIMGKDQEFSISPDAAARIENDPRVFKSDGSTLPIKASFVDLRLLLAVHPASPYLAGFAAILSSPNPPEHFVGIVRSRSGYGPGASPTSFSRKAVETEIDRLSTAIRADMGTALKSFARTAGVNVIFDFSRWRGAEIPGSTNGFLSESPRVPGYGIADFKTSINPGDSGMGHFEDLLREGSVADNVLQAALETTDLFLRPFRNTLLTGITATRQGGFDVMDEPCTRKVAGLMLGNLGLTREIVDRALKFIDENGM